MGLVINPVAFRIGHFHSWMDAWYMHRMYYSDFLHDVLLLKTLMFFMFYDLFFMEKYMYFLYSHMNLFFKFSKIFANIFVYDCTDRTFFYSWLNYLNYDKFRRVRLKTFWLKKKLLTDNVFGLDLFLILYHLGIHFDEMELESLKMKHSWRLRRLIENLRKKYGEDFIAREEIYMLERLFLYFKGGFYKFGTLYSIRYYLKWYFIKKRKLSFFLRRYNSRRVNRKRLLRLKYNYIFLFVVLAVFNQFLMNSSPRFPYYERFTRMENMYIIRFFVYWFGLRSVYFHFSKFVEIAFLRLGLRVYCRFFILTNSCITALFVARFIALGIYSRFSFKDLMIPIRRSLHRLMYVRVYHKTAKIALKLNNQLRKKQIVFDFKFMQKFLRSRFNFFIINLIINLSDIKLKYSLLYHKTKWVYFLNRKSYRFFWFNKFFENLKFKLCRNLNYIKVNYLVIRLKFKKDINKYKWNNTYLFNKIEFNNYIIYDYLTNYYLIKLNLIKFDAVQNLKFFNSSNIEANAIEELYIKLEKSNKHFFFLLFKKFLYRLYIYTGHFIRKIHFNKYKKLLLNKFLRRRRVTNWIIYKMKFNGKNLKKSRMYNYILKYLRRQRRVANHFLPKNRRILRKYRLISKLLKRNKFYKDDKDILWFLRFSIKRLKWFIFIKKVKKRKFWKELRDFRKFRSVYKKANRKEAAIKKYKIKKEKQRNKKSDMIWSFIRKRFKRKTPYNKRIFVSKINLYFFFIYKNFILRFYKYDKFTINIKKMFTYLHKLDDLDYIYNKKFYDVSTKLLDDKLDNEIMTPLKYKLKRRKYLDSGRAILYGYKFHFKGRFKRKQKSSNLWFVKGAMPNSTMIQEVDRGFFTFYSMFGACTVRVWFYRGDSSPKYTLRVN